MDIKDITGAGEIVKQVGEMAKEPVANLVNPITKTFGQRLSDIVDLIFTPIEKFKIYKDHKVEEFKRSLDKKINAIPEGKKVEPPLNVVGPAIEAAKYHIEDDKLREMFVELIAKSMNNDTTNLAHPSFVEIIKQLSPLEARLLAEFRLKTPQYFGISVSGPKIYTVKNGKEIRVDENGNEIEDIDETPPHITGKNSQLIGYSFPKTDKPIVSYYVLDSTNGNVIFIQNNVVRTETTTDIAVISSAITNLVRLGLIEIDFAARVKSINGNTDIYNCFLESPLLPDWKKELVHPLLRNIQVQGHPTNYDAAAQNKNLEIKKGVAKLTQFGDNFIKVCVLEAEFVKA